MTNTQSDGWYGAIEVKWPGYSIDAHKVRLEIVQDAMRLAFIETSNLNAHLLVVGGSEAALHKLFDHPHPSARDREDRRSAFGGLFARSLTAPEGELRRSMWATHFPGVGDRIPTTVFGDFDGKLKCELLAAGEPQVAHKVVGRVFVWQCNRTRGSA